MNERIFKKGDRVFHFVFGWGSVTGDSEKGVCDVVFENRESVTIPCKEIHLSFCKYDLINGGLSHERPFGLEVGKSYMSESGYSIIINRVGNYSNYGFFSGDWTYKIPCYTPKIWREATDEEVRSALEKETIRRYGENWEDVKIVKSIGMVPYGDNNGEFDVEIKEYSSSGWVVWNKNGCLFKKGVWAEKLEELELRPKFEVGELILVRDNDSEDWVTRFFDSYGEDYLITVGGDTWGQFMKFDEDFHNTAKSPEK